MKLSKCTLGTIVCTKNQSNEIDRVGMIVGITNNCMSADLNTRSKIERAVPLVKFSGEHEPRGVHYSNLYLYKD